jgi:hypothetical protein
MVKEESRNTGFRGENGRSNTMVEWSMIVVLELLTMMSQTFT